MVLHINPDDESGNGHGELACLARSGVNVCPEAWFLQRFGHMPDADAKRRLEHGTR